MIKIIKNLLFLFLIFASQNAWCDILLTGTVSAFVPYEDRTQIAFAGDSITVGNQSTAKGGYRFDLLSYLTTYYDNVTPNIVGADYFNNYSYPSIGASGITSTTLKNSYVETQLAAVPSSTMKSPPDVVFLLIGTNDFLTSAPRETWLSNLTSIINSFRTANPDCHVFVGNLIDRDTYTATVNDWNAAQATTLAGMADYNTFIHLVDLNSAIGAYSGTYYADSSHPNSAGYSLLASAWWTAYQSVF